ncbi:hypothetical protein [Aquimarina algiphila]|uniref:hypothetical protein n=1 Tax=Aquimarina algiphila TaxID=2047982 RepID=UPI00232AA3AD|nr:hypothetical protein [Aquimarina algiphila]
MTKIIQTICIAILFSYCTTIYAQREIEAPSNGDEYIDDGYPGDDLDEDIIAGDFDLGTESKNIRINFTLNSFLLNHSLINSINKRGYEAWFNKQKDIVKKAIEDKLNKRYNHLNDGLKDVIKRIETRTVTNEIRGVLSKYGGKVATKAEIRDKDIRNIKLLDFRKAEIRSGKINSELGHLKYGATPIKNFRTISQIDQLRATDLNHLKDNEALWTKENNALLMLAEIQNGVNGRTIGSHPFMNHTAQQQLNYIYSSRDDLVDLDLMQLYVNSVDRTTNGVAFLYNQRVYMKTFAAANFIENYALNFNPRPPSVFSSAAIDYFKKIHGPFQAAYELGRARELKIRELLNSISTEDMLNETLINGLGDRNKQFLKERPNLRKEVKAYFKTNGKAEIAYNCINYLLNQLQDDNNFEPNTNLYLASGTPSLQNFASTETMMHFNLNTAALNTTTGGFKGFGNVLAVLFENGEFAAYEGFIIRKMLAKNGISIPSSITDEWIGKAFDFTKGGDNRIYISHVNRNGIELFSNNIRTMGQWITYVTNLATRMGLNTPETRGILFANPKYVFELNTFVTSQLANGPLHLVQREFLLEALKTIKLHPTRAIIRYPSRTIVGDPCKDIKNHTEKNNIITQYNRLKDLTGERVENGFAENKTGPIQTLTHAPGGHSLDLSAINTGNARGYTHTHLNDYKTGRFDPVSGAEFISKPYRIHSPADILKFLQIVKLSTNSSLNYVDVVANTGNYTLRFTGNKASIVGLRGKAFYRSDYRRIMRNNSLEKGVLLFLRDIIGINGVELYKFSLDGKKIDKKTLDARGNVETTRCN